MVLRGHHKNMSSDGGFIRSKLSEIDDMLSDGMSRMGISGVNGALKEPSSVASTRSIMAKELNRLTAQEREQILMEIHGIADTIDESVPEFVETRLNAMDDAINSTPEHHKKSYMEALELNAAYTTDSSFRLRFLRAEKFNTRDAARRMIRFMDAKKELFGRQKLGKLVGFDDLDPEAQNVVRSGVMQILLGRDRADRGIFMSFSKLRTSDNSEQSWLRAGWYIHMVASESERNQINGVVEIIYSVCHMDDSIPRIPPTTAFKIASVMHCIPLRTVGFHLCLNDPAEQKRKEFLLLFFGSRLRRRVRLHSGTHVECQYELMTFGIPNDMLPVSTEGVVNTSAFRRLLDDRLTFEKQRDEQNKVMESSNNVNAVASKGDVAPALNSPPPAVPGFVFDPGEKTILCGKGRAIQDHQGNMVYRRFVSSFQNSYDEAGKHEKSLLVNNMVQVLVEGGWRFLKQTPEGWVEVEKEFAREKVKHLFRNRRPTAGGASSSKRRPMMTLDPSNNSSGQDTDGSGTQFFDNDMEPLDLQPDQADSKRPRLY